MKQTKLWGFLIAFSRLLTRCIIYQPKFKQSLAHNSSHLYRLSWCTDISEVFPWQSCAMFTVKWLHLSNDLTNLPKRLTSFFLNNPLRSFLSWFSTISFWNTRLQNTLLFVAKYLKFLMATISQNKKKRQKKTKKKPNQKEK